MLNRESNWSGLIYNNDIIIISLINNIFIIFLLYINYIIFLFFFSIVILQPTYYFIEFINLAKYF